MVWPVRIMICVLFVIAWPIAKLLEWILGPHDGIVYRRTELKELVALHAESAGRHGDLDVDTVAIVGATLDLQVKTVKQAMTPISDLFSLPITAKLDFETLGKILEAGHSRIPVYEEIPVESDSNEKKTRRKVIGVLLTKQLILLDPEDATPLREIPINPLPLVADDLALLQILNTFQEGRSHMAIVCRRKFACAPAQSQPPLLETIPSASSDSDLERGTPGGGGGSKDEGFLHSLFRRKRSSSASSTRSSSTTHHEKRSVRSAAEVNVEKTAPPPSFSTLNVAAELDDEFPQGIITLEDVLEELIGEGELTLSPSGSLSSAQLSANDLSCFSFSFSCLSRDSRRDGPRRFAHALHVVLHSARSVRQGWEPLGSAPGTLGACGATSETKIVVVVVVVWRVRRPDLDGSQSIGTGTEEERRQQHQVGE